MKILVTGCAGLLGANYARHLIQSGHEVVGIDDLSGGYRDFLPKSKSFTFYRFNLENDSRVKKLFDKERPEVVFHFAAYAAEGLSPFIRNFNYRNNLLSSSNLINEAVNFDSKLVFTSSMAVYGSQQVPFTESTTPKPIDPYGIAKHAVEMDLELARQQFGLRYNIVRPHNVLGKYQNIWDKYRNVIGIFIRNSLRGEPILVYGDGLQTRAFSDIKFYMDPFDKLINGFDGQTFNIGADKFFTLNETAKLVQEVAAENGYGVSIKHAEPRHEVKHAYCDHTKAKELLGFTDTTNLQELISDMFAWAMQQPRRVVKKMDYEITKNLYEYWL